VRKPDRGRREESFEPPVRLKSRARLRVEESRHCFISFLYLALRKLIELVALRLRSAEYKEHITCSVLAL
jgi:hypothetical protein